MRSPAWTRWGLTVTGAMTAEEAGKQAGLNGWNVRTAPILADVDVDPDDDIGQLVRVPKKFATVRDNPLTGRTEPIGIVGNKYHIVQNEEAFSTLDYIVDESGALYDSVGQTPSGNKVFMVMKMPEGIQIAGEDAHDMYLMASNSHDGSSSFSVSVIMHRIICTNAVTGALKRARQTWTVRHTESVQGRIEEARAALRLTFAYVEEFEREMQEFLSTPLSEAQFRDFRNELIPESTSEHQGWHDRVERARGALDGLYFDAPTQEFGRGTAYAALNAAVEYADWFTPVRARGGDENVVRAERTLMSTATQGFKSKARQLLLTA